MKDLQEMKDVANCNNALTLEERVCMSLGKIWNFM